MKKIIVLGIAITAIIVYFKLWVPTHDNVQPLNVVKIHISDVDDLAQEGECCILIAQAIKPFFFLSWGAYEIFDKSGRVWVFTRKVPPKPNKILTLMGESKILVSTPFFSVTIITEIRRLSIQEGPSD
jgi:hypothetical protein